MTDQANDRVLAKVRKLLAMGTDNRGNEQERETAMRQAYVLLAKHNLSLEDVGDGTAREEERKMVGTRFESYPWAREIGQALADLFFCTYFYTTPRGTKKGAHFFVGKVSNATTASELAAYVVRSVIKQSVRQYGSATRPEACAFDKGASLAIRSRCWALRAEAEKANKPAESTGRALVLSNVYDTERAANAAWLAEHVGALKTAKDRQREVRDDAAYNAGHAYGKTVSLSNQLSTAPTTHPRIK